MTTSRLLIRSIFYYWRTNLAVLFGVMAGTAVIGGALVVGDSVRGSLRKMSLDRLGRIDHVLDSHRFFREDLIGELSSDPGFQQRFAAAAPALLMQGSLESETNQATSRANRVQIYGLDERFWKLIDHGGVAVPTGHAVVLSQRVAEQLRVRPGDEIELTVELPSTIPRDTLLGKRDETSRVIPLTVKAVLGETSGAGRLNLNPNQQLPPNAFMALDTLQSNVDLARSSDRRTQTISPARVNALFVAANSAADQTGKTAVAAAQSLTSMLSEKVKLADLFLRVVKNTEHNYLSLESEQQIIENAFADAGQRASDDLEEANKVKLSQSPVLVYLANEIVNAKDETKFAMYSVIAGLDFSKVPPFGPFEFEGPAPDYPLSDGDVATGGTGEIILNEWLAADLGVAVDDVIIVKYHVVGDHLIAQDGKLPEQKRRFRVRGIVKLDGTPADDRGLVPEVKGVTDAKSFAEWDQPFSMDLDRVTDRDEQYWDKYRATPKAFLSLSTAQEFWRSRYGQLTSLRVSKLPGKSLDHSADEFTRALLESLEPRQTGFIFEPVKYHGVTASKGANDFSQLFFAFSFFLILSATILIGLLFQLGIERRGTSVGLLSAVGFTPQKVRRLFLLEGLIVVCVGGVLGTIAAVGYASLMIYGLKTWWFGAIGTKFLKVYATPMSLALGFVISVAVTSTAVWWALRQLRTLSTRDLLAGATQQSLTVAAQRSRGRRASNMGAGSTIVALLLLAGAMAGLIPASEAFSGFSWQVVAFFVVGVLLLVAGLAYLSAWLDSDRSTAVRGGGITGMGRLGMRNASRHRQRSVLTVGLIASATFVIVAVAAAYRNPAVEMPDKKSGNGGFTLVAQSSRPILYDLNTTPGRNRLDLRIDVKAELAKLAGDDEKKKRIRRDAHLLKQMGEEKAKVMSFRVKPGEEASCRNLYQTTLPTVLGVPPEMIERGGFKFADTKADKPWELLVEESQDGTILVLGDMNTIVYSLKKGIGDTISVPDEQNPEYTLRIVGMFDGSVFQGMLLMSDENFRELYPDRKGYEYFLIEVPPDDAGALSNLLESKLPGFDVELVADRLAAFLNVQNTYLLTFQTLGGLGLLLGTFGLATVMLRNVLERRAELALLRAVGFENSMLAWLVLWENAFLLVWGLLAGSVSALLAMMPHLTSIGADVPWLAVGLILGGVFSIGMAAAFLAVLEAVRTPILATLRSE